MKNTLLIILLAAFSTLVLSAQVFKPVIEHTDCFLEDDQSLKDDPRIQFAFITVPEDYDNPDGRLLKLAFVIIKAADTNPEPDPIMHLTGGPGSKALTSAIINIFKNHPFSQNRDIILMDFRGIGFSEPAFCPEYQDTIFQMYAENLTPTEAKEKTLDQLSDCYDKLKAEGINLSKYNSAEVVKDLEMLRTALGIDHWNLWGISYGTRVAQTYMRDSPGSIRCVILDSPVPMGYPDWGDEIIKYKRSLKVFFNSCKENPECNNAFPDLEGQFYIAMNSLKDKPMTIKYKNGPDGLLHLNFQDLHLIVQQLLYDPGFYPILPWLIKGIGERNTEIFKNLLPRFEKLVHSKSDLMYVTVIKYDSGLILNDFHTDPNDPLHDALNYFDNVILMLDQIDFIRQDSLETRAVVSEIPSLILVGSVDPITPPVNAQLLKKSLSNSFMFEFPGRGHGLTRDTECAKSIAVHFLNDPLSAPESDCIGEMEANPINWVPKMYYNPRIATMAQQMLKEKRWYLIGGVALLALSFIISLVSALINLFKKTVNPVTPQVRIRNLITRISALLAILLF
jgi:pimeloyl-ACP methyl ester carboxylesterase